jgi:hypothetical protein
MRDGFKNLFGDEFAEGGLALGVTRGTEAALLAREREQVLVAAVGAPDAGKAIRQNPASVEALQGAGDDST